MKKICRWAFRLVLHARLFYRKNVAVVGGGDTACERPFLSGLAEKSMIVQAIFEGYKIMQERVFNTPIEVLFEHQTLGLFKRILEGATLVKEKAKSAKPR